MDNNSGIITFGQTGNNSITVAPPRLRLNDQIRAQLRKYVPKDRPGHIDIIGNSIEDIQAANEIVEFLRNNNYSFDPPEITGMRIWPLNSNKPLVLAPDLTPWVLTIQPSAH